MIILQRPRARIAYAPPVTSAIDLSVLPLAARQPLDWTLYTGRATAGGSSYLDPVSGRQVWRLTDATYPVANTTMRMDYSTGGPYMSGRLASGKHVIKCMKLPGPAHYFIDFDVVTGRSNARTMVQAPSNDLCFCFSENPSNYQYCYVFNNQKIYRLDAETNLRADSAVFPKDLLAAGVVTGGQTPGWATISADDRYICFMDDLSTPSKAIVYDAVSDVFLTCTEARMTTATGLSFALNEPQIEKGGRYVLLAKDGGPVNNPPGASGFRDMAVWDLVTDKISAMCIRAAHGSMLNGKMIAPNPDGSVVFVTRVDFAPVVTDQTNPFTQTTIVGTAPNGGGHTSGSFAVATDTTQVYVHSSFSEGFSTQGAWSVHSGEIYKSVLTWAVQGTGKATGDVTVYQFNASDSTIYERTLVKAASLGAMIEGTFFYDHSITTMYVWKVGGGSPTGKVDCRQCGLWHQAVALVRLDGGSTRYLAGSYNVGTNVDPDYDRLPFSSISPDGRIVSFDSSMGDTDGRADIFIVPVPFT